LSNKNTYENTDVTYNGGVEYGSDIHGVSIRTNQIIWDMIKILDRNLLFGFHFRAKISTHKTIIIMTHKEQNMLDKAKKLLVDFQDIPKVMFLAKIKEEKKKHRLFKIFVLILLLSILLFGLFELGLYWYNNNKSFNFIEDKKSSVIDVNNTTTIKLDIKKLKAIQESFDKENEPIKPEIMSALDVTTEIISDMVPPSKKDEYNAEALVKNFKGKGGIKFELDDSNMSSKDFNATIKELNSYAKNFVKDKNLTGALKCYDKIIEDEKEKNRDIKRDDMANALSQKASLDKLMGDLNSSENSYLKSLGITEELAKNDPKKYMATEAFNLAKLSKVEVDLNKTLIAQKRLRKAETKYSDGLEKFEKLYKKNPKQYREDLAWNYNILANFYLDDFEDLNKSIMYRKKAIKLYKNLYKKSSKQFTITLFKTYNSLGKTYIKLDDFNLSKKSYESGFEIIKKSKYKKYVALSYHNLGFISAKNIEFREAEIDYTKALKIYKKLDNNMTKDKSSFTENILQIDYDMASLYSYKKEFKEALYRYVDVIKEYKKLNKSKYKSNIAKIQNSIAWIYISRPKFKNYKKAKALIDSSIKLAKSIKEDNLKEYKEVVSKSYSYLAHLFVLENKIDKSLDYYKKSLGLKREFETDKRYTTLLVAQKSYLKAFRNFELMLETYKTKEKQAQMLMEYGEFYADVDSNTSKEKLEQSLNIYKQLSKIKSKEFLEINKIKSLLRDI